MPNLHALGLVFVFAAPATAFAQARIQTLGPATSVVFARHARGPLQRTLAPADTLRPVSIGTYAKEGAIAGGLLGAVGVGLLAEVGCGLSEDTTKNCTGSFLIGGAIGAALGALPGALIGGLFPKYSEGSKRP